MNYRRIYSQIVQRAKDRIPEGYVERHHIIPRCMGGSDEKENLVALYPEEHFVAHALLLKIYKDTEYRYALAKAVQKMTVGHKGRRSNRKLYGWLKREHALAMSEAQKGKGNSQYGTRWICHLDLKENRKIAKGEEIPEGWILGRSVWNCTNICPVCHTRHSKKRYCSKKCASAARVGKPLPEEVRHAISRSNRGKPGIHGFAGKKHSEETKAKMRRSHKERHQKHIPVCKLVKQLDSQSSAR